VHLPALTTSHRNRQSRQLCGAVGNLLLLAHFRCFSRSEAHAHASAERGLKYLQVSQTQGKLGTVAAKEPFELTEEVHST
jgi:hypothetical protein